MFRHGLLSDKKHTHTTKREQMAYFQKIRKKKIVEGYPPSHRAWMTFIQIKKGQSKFKCGGSIINNYWILSAGHCFCEQLKCKPTKKGKLKIDYNPQKHIRIVTGLKDIDLVQADKCECQISEPVKILIHPL